MSDDLISRKAECTALDKLYCREGKCRFYKASELIRAQGEQMEKKGKR